MERNIEHATSAPAMISASKKRSTPPPRFLRFLFYSGGRDVPLSTVLAGGTRPPPDPPGAPAEAVRKVTPGEAA